MPRRRKAMSRVKNNRKKATVDLRVQMSRIKVKMNQPYVLLANIPQKNEAFAPLSKDQRSCKMGKGWFL
jgi:hypothetical protein